MNEQLYQEWINALESDRYLPTINFLRVKDKFCCLGVLCDIYDTYQWVQINEADYSYLERNEVLPSLLVNELNLRSDLGHFTLEDLSPELQLEVSKYRFQYTEREYIGCNCSLTEINDRAPYPFPIIANVLREQPKSLFNE